MAGEGFIIPIEVVGVRSVTETAAAVDALGQKLSKVSTEAMRVNAALDKTATASSRKSKSVPLLPEIEAKDAVSNQFKFLALQAQNKIKEAKEFKELYQEYGGLKALARVQGNAHAVTAPYRELLRLKKELADLDAKASMYQKTKRGNSSVYLVTEAREYLKLLNQTAAATAKLSTRNQNQAQLAAAQERLLIPMREELKLKQQLAQVDARLKLRQQSSASDDQPRLDRLQEELRLRQQLAQAQARLASGNQQLQVEVAAQQNLLIPLREQIKLQREIATLRAKKELRDDPRYRQQQEQLSTLTRAEMQHVETQRAITKAYQDAARARALLSDEYVKATSGAKLSQEEKRAAELRRQTTAWEAKVLKAEISTSPEIKRLISQYNDLTAKSARATQATRAFSEQIAGTNQITAGFRAALAGVGMGFGIYTSATIMAATATYSFVAALRDVVISGAEFEQEMSRVSAAMNLTSEQYGDLSRRALEMANNSRYAAQDVVRAYREMAMSGFTYQETVDGIHSVLKMASIGMLEFGQAADIATNVLYGFNLDATDLAHVVDVLATTITRSAQDLEQLGTAMSYIAPVASSFGISLETAAAATEVLANAGIKSSRAGTGMRRTFTALFSDTEKVAKELGELGVTVNTMAYDMDAEFIRVLEELHVATNGATSGVGNLTRAVGLYAVPAFLNLIKAAGEGEGSLRQILQAYEEVGGAATRMQQAMEENLKVDFEKMLASLSALKQAVFAIIGPELRDGLQAFTGWLRALAEDKDAIKELVETLKGLGEIALWLTGIIGAGAFLKGGLGFLGRLDQYRKDRNLLKETRKREKELADAARQTATSSVSVGANGKPLTTTIAPTVVATGGLDKEMKAAKEATDQMTKIGMASRALSLGLRAVAGIGVGMMLWDVGKALLNLAGITPKAVDQVNKLSDAYRTLKEDLKDYRLQEIEGLGMERAIDAANNKVALQEALARANELREKLAILEKMSKEAAPGSVQAATIDTRIKQMQADLKAVDESIDGLERKYQASMAAFAEGELSQLQKLKVDLEVDLTFKRGQLTDLNEEVERVTSDTRYETLPEWKKDRDKVLNDYAAIKEEVAKLEALLKKVKQQLGGYGDNLVEIGEAAREAAKGHQQVNEEIEKYHGKITDFIKQSESEAKALADANNLESASIQKKVDHYEALVTAQQDTLKALRDNAEMVKRSQYMLESLETKSPAGMADAVRAQMEEMQQYDRGITIPVAIDTESVEQWKKYLQEQVANYEKMVQTAGTNKEAYLEALKALQELRKEQKAFKREIDELRQSLSALLKTASTGNLADTLFGNVSRVTAEVGNLIDRVTEMGREGITVKTESLDTANASMKEMVAQAERLMNLDPGSLDALWFAESSRGRTAGTHSSRMVTDEKTGKSVEIVGQFQIQPATAREVGIEKLDTEWKQVLAAARYFKQGLDKTGNYRDAFKYYHGGPDRSAWGPKTERHAARAMAEWDRVRPDKSDLMKALEKIAPAAREGTAALGAMEQQAVAASQAQEQTLQQIRDRVKGGSLQTISKVDLDALQAAEDKLLLQYSEMLVSLEEKRKGLGTDMTQEEKESLQRYVDLFNEVKDKYKEVQALRKDAAKTLVAKGVDVPLGLDSDELAEVASQVDTITAKSEALRVALARIDEALQAGAIKAPVAAYARMEAEITALTDGADKQAQSYAILTKTEAEFVQQRKETLAELANLEQLAQGGTELTDAQNQQLTELKTKAELLDRYIEDISTRRYPEALLRVKRGEMSAAELPKSKALMRQLSEEADTYLNKRREIEISLENINRLASAGQMGGAETIIERMNRELEALDPNLDQAAKDLATWQTLKKAETELLREQVQAQQELERLKAEPGMRTEEEVAQIERLTTALAQYQGALQKVRELKVPLAEEKVMEGLATADDLLYSPEQLKALASGYDAAWSRSRKYYLVMVQIKQLEDAGYLTKTEAALERINAELENTSPLTRQFSEELVGAFKNIITGAETAGESFESLKKTLLDLGSEEIIIPIVLSATTKFMDPLVRGFQDMIFSSVQGIGSMMLNSLFGLFGANSTAAGSGIGGAGGMSNLFSLSGLTSLFGGYSMGTAAGAGLARFSANAFGSLSPGMGNAVSGLALTPNWAFGLGGLGGSLLGGALFGNKGYGGIGSSIGGTAGSFGGAALAGLLGVTGPVGAIIGGLLGGVGGGFLGSLFGDDKPKYGRLMADVGGRVSQLEDWENGPANYAKGAFGLTFGLSDAATKNVKASEFKETFDAMAQVSKTLADFYGPGLSKKIEKELAKWPYLWGGEFENIGAAMADIFGNIADVAAQTGDETAQVFDALLGTLSGTEEEVANQIEKAMAATEGMIVTMGQLMGTEIAKAFDLNGTAAENAKQLADYLKQFAEEGENTTDAIIRLTTQLAQLQFALTQTATTIEGLTKQQLVKLSDDLAQVFGGVENMVKYLSIYYEQFFTASQKATDAIKVTINKLNAEFPKIKQALEDMAGAREFDFTKFALPDLKKALQTPVEDLKKAIAKATVDHSTELNPMELWARLRGWKPETDTKSPTEEEPWVKRMQDRFKVQSSGETPQNKGKLSTITDSSTAAAKQVMKAIEAYYKGIELGSVKQSDEVEKKLTEVMNSYGAEFKALGIDISKGLDSIVGQMKELNLTLLSAEDLKGLDVDKNALIYAELVEDMPKTRAAFNDLIGQIDLTTESGKLLYAELMKLAGSFDALYDAIEGFEKWLGVTNDEDLAKANLTKVFKEFGMALPSSKDALLQMYKAGKFTAEQLAILGANLEDLDVVFGSAETWDPYEDLTNATISKLEQALAKFTEELNKSKGIVEAAKSAIENLRKASDNQESYMEELRQRARVALGQQRLPDDVNDIIRGLGEVNEEDYGTREDFLQAIFENENLLRQLKLRAENQVNYDQKQVDLLQEQIDLAKEALLKEKTVLQESIEALQKELTEAYKKLQTMWDTGLGKVVVQLDGVLGRMDLLVGYGLALPGQIEKESIALQGGILTSNQLLTSVDATLKSIHGILNAPTATATATVNVPESPQAPVDYTAGPTEAEEYVRDLQMEELILEVRRLRTEFDANMRQSLGYARRSTDVLVRWDGDGLPPDNEDYLRQIAYNTRPRNESPCT